MSKCFYVASAACALALCLSTARTQTLSPPRKAGAPSELPPNSPPDLGFDYRAVITEHQALIDSGQAGKAVEYLVSRYRYPKASQPWETLKNQLAFLHSNAGKSDGYVLSRYRRISSRTHEFRVLSYYEHSTVEFKYGFERFGGEWKILVFGINSIQEEFMKEVPFQSLVDK